MIIIGIDPGNPYGWCIFKGWDYYASGERKVEGNNIYALISRHLMHDIWEQVEFQGGEFKNSNIANVIVCEKLFVGKTKQSEHKKAAFLMKSSIELANRRGACLAALFCDTLLEPYPQSWKRRRNDKQLRIEAEAIAGRKVGKHERDAIHMANFGVGVAKTDAMVEMAKAQGKDI